ncbi:MAG: TfoX/Sxy family protein [Agathobaculum sp.]|uniref:TfoX/Sxy family protein n=1 Tax=Agathobaculum sp. TaxID=2048138 RepID=UPI0025BB04F1|nr:TfoX/Sxy family protein [Agathobaculum sp.]MCI7126157.1 TfoX/Sxy family protein [Agathobaculum sp.]MDY3711346.1 TfoX/Sxy family protein [Agathobaculum sp.]
MATDPAFARYVCAQLADAGEIVCKRLFGEYGLWHDGVFFGTIEDNMLCLKITAPGRALLPQAEIVEPHEGARFLHVEQLDDRALLAELVRQTCGALPAPRRRRKKGV